MVSASSSTPSVVVVLVALLIVEPVVIALVVAIAASPSEVVVALEPTAPSSSDAIAGIVASVPSLVLIRVPVVSAIWVQLPHGVLIIGVNLLRRSVCRRSLWGIAILPWRLLILRGSSLGCWIGITRWVRSVRCLGVRGSRLDSLLALIEIYLDAIGCEHRGCLLVTAFLTNDLRLLLCNQLLGIGAGGLHEGLIAAFLVEKVGLSE